MLGAFVLRGALRAFATMFGSFGIFFLYMSFALRPSYGASALVFLGAASAIILSEPRG